MTQEHSGEEARRLVTVLFADLVGYTTLSEARDPELIQEALSQTFERLAVEIRRFGGYVDKVVGDEIMALFGAPRAQEDDAGKAVAAAVAMQRALEEIAPQLEARLGQGLSARIGINTGLVVTGAVGPGGYTVTGDAVNVAARLEKAAEPGAVLVGEATRRLARRPFRWGERQEFQVKGRSEPVACFTVEGVSAAPLRLVPAPSDTPFVGRQEHLDRLRAAWEDASGGRMRVVQLTGEAGIGKTRLLAHLFRLVAPAPENVLYTRTDTPPRTFGPILQLLPSLRESLPPGFEERIEALARVHEEAVLPEVEPDWLVKGLADVIERLSRGGAVAFVLDDVHRADAATIQIIDRLLPRLVSLPVLVLLLRQPTGRRPRRVSEADTIVIEALDEESARALVSGVAPALSAATVSEIVSRAGGNPLYLEMLATATLAAPDALVPESLQTAIVARVDELDESARRLVREASVFGQSFHEEPLKLTTTVSEGLYETLAHLCEVGLLDELPDTRHRGYQFRHSLVQQVLYEGLLLRQRTELHRKAAEALELAQEEGMEVEPEQIAFHLQEAGENERAASYHLVAADRADHLRAPMEARRHRRAANRLLNAASLAGLYATHARPSLAARAGAAVLQAGIGMALVLPVFLVFAMRRPEPNMFTLGLPFEIIDFNPSSVLLAVVLGGAPLLIAGIAFTHLAVPVLMRRNVSVPVLAGVVLGGWIVALGFVALGYVALLLLLRLGALDGVSSMYIGGATLQILLGNYDLVLTAAIGTLAVAVVWTVLLRAQVRGWARLRRSSLGPREIEEGRRWAAVRQLGLLATAVGALTIALLAAYQVEILPGGSAQAGLGGGPFVGLMLPFAVLTVGGANTVFVATRRLRAKAGAYQLGLFGFEVPLILALVFGVVVWFGMRQAVIVSANDVDTPGDVGAFDRAISLFPDLASGYYLRGERHLAAEDYEAALDDFNKAAELDPEFPATYLARARVLIELGEYDRAIEDGTRLIELRPDHPGGYALRAWARAETGNVTEAAEDLAQATRPLPEDVQAWDAFFVRCLALAAVERYDEAQADCERVLDLNPDHIISLDQLSFIAFTKAGQESDRTAAAALYQQGIEYATRVLEIDDERTVAWANRGEGYSFLGEYEKAEADLSRAIELDPEFVRAYQERGLNRLYLDRAADAQADLARAIELYVAQPDPAVDGSELYSTELFVALHAGAYDTAIRDADTLEQLGFATPWVLSNRGYAYVERGDVQRGLSDIERSLQMDADHAQGYDRRGYAYFLLNDYDRAEADFQQGLSRIALLQPEEQAELHYHRALLYRAQGRTASAGAELVEAENLVEVPSVRRQIKELQDALAQR